MKSILAVTLIGFFLIAPLVFANGVSFYERTAIANDGELEFVEGDQLPASNRLLLNCHPRRQAGCEDEVVRALRREREREANGSLRAWKFFLEGLVYLETRRYDEAVAALLTGADQSQDRRLEAAIKHRLAQVYLLKFEAGNLMRSLEAIKSEFPNYNLYEDTFRTYPYSLCERRWCISTPSISTMTEQSAKLSRIKELRAALEKTPNLGQNPDAYATKSVELAKLYDEICPERSIFSIICPPALEIYERVVREVPDAKGADYSFLMVQTSGFAYEYEGDEIARAKDVVRLYGEFLKRYPESELAKDVQQQHQNALKILGQKE